jgi:hypothetical protein
MSDIEFDLRVERVKKAADVIGSLPTKSLQLDAFRYLLGQAVVTTQPPSVPASTAVDEAPDPIVKDKKPRRTSAAKSPISQDRDVVLFPKDKKSFKDFAAEKAPASHTEKYAVAVYWLREVAGYGEATVAQVVSAYRAAGWPLPAQVANAASQAVKVGFLSSGKADDLQLSSGGINLVDSELPRAKV